MKYATMRKMNPGALVLGQYRTKKQNEAKL